MKSIPESRKRPPKAIPARRPIKANIAPIGSNPKRGGHAFLKRKSFSER